MSQSLVKNYLHIVFSTQERLDLIPDGRRQDFWAYIGGVINHCGGHSLLVGGTANHVHILCTLDATANLSNLIRDIKSRSTKWFKDNVHTRLGFAWQSGYAAFSVSQSSVAAVRDYILNQEAHHKKHLLRMRWWPSCGSMRLNIMKPIYGRNACAPIGRFGLGGGSLPQGYAPLTLGW